jgi:hypothetical protein
MKNFRRIAKMSCRDDTLSRKCRPMRDFMKRCILVRRLKSTVNKVLSHAGLGTCNATAVHTPQYAVL